MIEENRIKKNLEKLSFPRLSGTPKERIAFNLIKQDVNELDLTFSTQEFKFSSFYARVYPKIVFTLASLLLYIIFLNIRGWFTQSSLITIGITLIFMLLLNKNPEKIKFGKVFSSQNLIVKYPSKSNEINSIGILIFAHLDSKGQRLSINIRIWNFRIWLASFIIGMIIILLYNNLFFGVNNGLYFLCIVLLIINFFSTFLILINITNKKSDGAADNASGVVCVLELLNHYLSHEKRLENYDLWFVFTGAEECGTMGIRHFCKNLKYIDKNESIFINFDAIGKVLAYFSSFINPYKNSLLYNKFQKAAKKIDLKYHFTNRSFGIKSDGLYLKSKGFRGFGFGDLDVYKHVHSVNDTIDKVDTKLLKKLCLFITEILKEIDDHKRKK